MRTPRLIGAAAVLGAVLGCGRAQWATDAYAGFDVASLPGLSLWLLSGLEGDLRAKYALP
jgi:hypothetical protein